MRATSYHVATLSIVLPFRRGRRRIGKRGGIATAAAARCDVISLVPEADQQADGGAARRHRVTHRTEYRYSDVVTSSYGRGFLTPRDSLRQRCVAHRLTIDPAPADSSTSTDCYGNISSYFHVTEPHHSLTVTSDSIVDVNPPAPGLYTTGPAVQPWEAARPAGRRGALATEFTLDLDPPEITDEVRDYAAPSFAPGRPLIEVLRDLASRIFTDFTYRSGSTTISTGVAEVLAAREGVCQDFARLAIACLRAHGLAASYVSGYLATDPLPERTG